MVTQLPNHLLDIHTRTWAIRRMEQHALLRRGESVRVFDVLHYPH